MIYLPGSGHNHFVTSSISWPLPGRLSKLFDRHSQAVSVVGNAASVEMAMDGYHEHDFTDYFQLLKVDGHWWIVSKLFHADPQSK